eukprot:6753650-Lingulodinium_polyedra.AAC.1
MGSTEAGPSGPPSPGGTAVKRKHSGGAQPKASRQDRSLTPPPTASSAAPAAPAPGALPTASGVPKAYGPGESSDPSSAKAGGAESSDP